MENAFSQYQKKSRRGDCGVRQTADTGGCFVMARELRIRKEETEGAGGWKTRTEQKVGDGLVPSDSGMCATDSAFLDFSGSNI